MDKKLKDYMNEDWVLKAKVEAIQILLEEMNSPFDHLGLCKCRHCGKWNIDWIWEFMYYDDIDFTCDFCKKRTW